MASVTPTFTSTNDDAQIATWSTMTSSNVDGSSISSVKYPDRTVQFSGTFNGATCILQGSNDNSNFFTLTNPAGTSISMTAAGIQAVVESPLWIKPSTSGGGGSATGVTGAGGGFPAISNTPFLAWAGGATDTNGNDAFKHNESCGFWRSNQ